MIKAVHIRDSSFHPHVVPGEPSPENCVANGPGSLTVTCATKNQGNFLFLFFFFLRWY